LPRGIINLAGFFVRTSFIGAPDMAFPRFVHSFGSVISVIRSFKFFKA